MGIFQYLCILPYGRCIQNQTDVQINERCPSVIHNCKAETLITILRLRSWIKETSEIIRFVRLIDE